MGYANSIAEAIARMGNAQAQGALQRGQIYGNLAQNLGNLPGQMISGMQQYKQNQLETQSMQLKLEQQKRDAEFQKQYQAIASQTGLPEPVLEQQLDNLVRQYPEKWQVWEQMKERKAQMEARQTKNALDIREAQTGAPGLPGLPTVQAQPTGPLGQMELQPSMPQEQIMRIGETGPEQVSVPYEQRNFPTRVGQNVLAPAPTQRQQQQTDLQAQLQKARIARLEKGPTVVAPGAAVLPPGGTTPIFTNPAKPSGAQGVGRTVQVNGRVMQFNPETQKYDIDVGPVDDPNAPREPKKYGSMQFVQIFDPKSGLPQNYWVDTVKQTITPAIPGGRTEPREIAGQSQTVIQGADVSIPVLNELEKDLKTLDTGPLRGRAAAISLSALGGVGLSKEEVAIRSKLGRLTADQIFGEGGKQLTETEKAMIQPYVVNQTDTVQTALAKVPELRKRVERIRNSRFNMMNPRTRAVHSNILKPGSSAEPPPPEITSPEADPLGLFK